MLILNGEVFTDGQFQKKDIMVEDGLFTALTPQGSLMPKGAEQCIDAAGKRIIPGLVDVHSHGREGEDFSFADEEALQSLCNSYAACGVTAVLGTTMTNQPSAVEKSLGCIAAYGKTKHPGAKLLGIHMEGPFLGKDKKGAHDEQYLKEPDWEEFCRLQKQSDNRVRLITIDPTLSKAEDFIRLCREHGVFVSLGHTSCDYDTALRAGKAGADHVTHLFNAMNPLHHRSPGLVGAALDTGMYTELICDGIHLHPAIIRMMFALHPEQMLLISDSMQAAGLSDGEYELGGLKVFVENGKATQEDGTIAGSTISVYDAVVNAIRFGVPARQAILSASSLPAKSVGMEGIVGSIALNRAADFLIVSEDWKLEQVYIDGALYGKI